MPKLSKSTLLALSCSLSLGVASQLSACSEGDDSPTASGDEDATEGDEEEGSEGSGASGSEGEGGDDETGDTEEEIPTELEVSGTVVDYNPLLPMELALVGAQISLFEEPSISAVSDDEGNYALSGVALNSMFSVQIEPSDDYLGAYIRLATEQSHLDDFALTQVSRDFIAQQQVFLDEARADYDADKALILVRLLQTTAAGEGVFVTLDPAPAENSYFAPDAMGIPLLNSTEVLNSIFPTVAFYNLEGMEPGDYTVTVTHPERECVVSLPAFPTQAGFVTLVDVDCPPPA